MRYLLITFIRKPNGQIDEQVTISKKVRTSDIQSCNVILDYAKKKIDKCVIQDGFVSASSDNLVFTGEDGGDNNFHVDTAHLSWVLS